MGIRLYVGNLSYQTNQDELTEIFSEAGQVAAASVMTDRYSGQSRGFGFVEMATDEEAQNAVRLLNGRSVGGRALVVNEARPRSEGGGGGGARSSGGYSGGGGGGGYSGGGGGGGYSGGGGGGYSGGGGGYSGGGNGGGGYSGGSGGGRGGNRTGGSRGNADRYERDRY